MANTFFWKGIIFANKNKHLLFLLLLPVTNIIFTPIQSRLISPSLLGLYTSYLLIVSMAGIFSTLKVETMMYHSNEEDEYKKIGGTSLHVLKFTTLFFTLTISIFWYFYSKGNFKQVLTVFLITPLIFFSQGVDNISRLYNIRLSKAQYYYKLSFFRNLLKNMSIISFVWALTPSLLSILFAELIGKFPALWSQIKNISGQRIKDSFQWIILNRKNTIYYSVSLLINSVTSSMPVLFIQYKDAAYGGEYAMYYRLCCVPCMLIATIFADKMGDRKNESKKVQYGIFKVLIIISLASFVIFQFTPSFVYTYFLGAKWVNIGDIIRGLALSLVLEMIFSSISILFVFKKLISYKYWFDGLFLLATVIPFMVPKLLFFDQIFLLNILRSAVAGIFIFILLIKIRK